MPALSEFVTQVSRLLTLACLVQPLLVEAIWCDLSLLGCPYRIGARVTPSKLAIFVCATAIALASHSGTARAQIRTEQPASISPAPGPDTFRIVYEATGQCPDKGELVRQVLARARTAREATDDESVRTFTVEIQPRVRGVWGRLRVQSADSGEWDREVSAADCSEAIAALALVIAVVIDSGTSTASAPLRAPGPSRRAPAPLPPPAALPPRQPEHPWRPGVGMAVGVLSGIAPALSPSAEAYADISRSSDDVVAPMVQLGIVGAKSTTTKTPVGFADFLLIAARARVCPLRLPAGTAVALRPCGIGEAGVLRGEGSGIAQPATATMPWLLAGGSGRVEILTSEGSSLNFEVGVVVPALKHRFHFDPGRPWEHRVSAAVVGVSIGLTMRWP